MIKNNKSVRFNPTDRLILGYCGLMIALVLGFGRPLAGYTDELISYTAIAVLVWILVRFLPESTGKMNAIIRAVYPALLFTFFYRLTGGQMFLFFDHFFDAQVINFESRLFGIEPTLYIDRNLLNVWVTEIVSFCYFTYYLMVPVFIIAALRRMELKIIKPCLAACTLTFFASYLLFALYPVEGPRWQFAHVYINSIDGPLFRPLVEFVIENAAVRGGAMPSSHVGVALVILMFSLKHYRPLGWILLPLNIGLAIGTVWGRFHYISDVFVGAAFAVASVILVWKKSDCFNAPSAKDKETTELRIEHAA